MSLLVKRKSADKTAKPVNEESDDSDSSQQTLEEN
jgi:hypothetical protein